MPGTIEQLKMVSAKLLTAANKRRAIAKGLRKAGFIPLGRGAWLGYRGKDIVSGLLIEGSPSDTYVSSFILPVFDEHTFISWTLGRRIVHCSPEIGVDYEVMKATNDYLDHLLSIQSASELVEYIDSSGNIGFYAIWARYLCLLRAGRLRQAREYLDVSRLSELHATVLKRFSEVKLSVEQGDVAAVHHVLKQWEETSRRIFGHEDFALTVT